jgi:hypothetical protein
MKLSRKQNLHDYVSSCYCKICSSSKHNWFLNITDCQTAMVEFCARSGHVGFVDDKVSQGQADLLSYYFGLSYYVKLSPCTPWMRMGEWMYRSTFHWPATRCKQVISITPWPLHHRGQSPWYTMERRLSGPQSRPGWRREKKVLSPTATRTQTSRSSSPQPVAIPAVLPPLTTKRDK